MLLGDHAVDVRRHLSDLGRETAERAEDLCGVLGGAVAPLRKNETRAAACAGRGQAREPSESSLRYAFVGHARAEYRGVRSERQARVFSELGCGALECGFRRDGI